MWTADQSRSNIKLYEPCAEGLAWSDGKDSDQIWSTMDAEAAPYLFWWAAMNVGQPGWKQEEDLRAAVTALVVFTEKYGLSSARAAAILAMDKDVLNFFNWLTRQVGEENQSQFYAEILPVIRGLAPTI